jgi:hypothetical protein
MKSRIATLWLAAVASPILLVGCQTANTGQAGKPAQTGKPATDPQSRLEPMSEPGEGQKLLEKMAGDWKVTKKFYPRTGEPSVVGGECTQKMIHGGRFLESDFVFHDPGGDSTGTGTIGFDPTTGLFTSFWVDSRSTRISLRQSKGTFSGMEIVLFSKPLAEAGPAARESRTVSHLENNGHSLIHQQFGQLPDGSGERLVMELIMTRK